MVSSKSKNTKERPVGILLVNIGSPGAPTPSALRTYLAEFLRDPRVIDWPRWLWLPVLYAIILKVRPKRSAELYRNIWDEGAPLLNTAHSQAAQLEGMLGKWTPMETQVSLGMRYGRPSIDQALRNFRDQGIRQILVLPLFPQYSSTTTASVFDAINKELRTWSWLPEI